MKKINDELETCREIIKMQEWERDQQKVEFEIEEENEEIHEIVEGNYFKHILKALFSPFETKFDHCYQKILVD